MTEQQILLAYIALGCGIALVIGLVVALVLMYRKGMKLYNVHRTYINNVDKNNVEYIDSVRKKVEDNDKKLRDEFQEMFLSQHKFTQGILEKHTEDFKNVPSQEHVEEHFSKSFDRIEALEQLNEQKQKSAKKALDKFNKNKVTKTKKK